MFLGGLTGRHETGVTRIEECAAPRVEPEPITLLVAMGDSSFRESDATPLCQDNLVIVARAAMAISEPVIVTRPGLLT